MPRRILTPLGLAVGLVGCQPSLSAEADWARWFSYREILDMAVSADGDAVIGGYVTSDATAPDSSWGHPTSQPFFARIDEDGALLDSWTGFFGSVSSVAMDEHGAAYLLVRGLRDQADWTLPEYCELRALDPDGGSRWTKRWSELPSCPRDVAVAGNVVAALVGDTLEAFALGGEPLWQQPMPGSPVLLATEGEAIWSTAIVARDDGNQVVARRHDLDGRETARLDVELGDRSLFAFQPVEDGALLLVFTPLDPPTFPPSPEPRLTPHFQLLSVSSEGELRWERTTAEPAPEEGSRWARFTAAVTAEGTTPWVLGTERQSPSGASSDSEHRRMILQRWSPKGEVEGTLLRTFVETHHDAVEDLDPVTLARSECPWSDVAIPVQLGSVGKKVVARPDGSLLVAGRQGCRDSFLMHLVVEQ